MSLLSLSWNNVNIIIIILSRKGKMLSFVFDKGRGKDRILYWFYLTVDVSDLGILKPNSPSC